MGKKVRDIQPSKSHKKQFNKLIKLLKPKVYITPSSNFKNLVQQLTGNKNNIRSSSSPSPPPAPPSDDDIQRLQLAQELSVDSSEGSIPSSIDITNMLRDPCFSLLDNNNSMGSLETTDSISEEDYYRNIESWLLEMDSYMPLNIHEEVSTFDDYGYDLSTLF